MLDRSGSYHSPGSHYWRRGHRGRWISRESERSRLHYSCWESRAASEKNGRSRDDGRSLTESLKVITKVEVIHIACQKTTKGVALPLLAFHFAFDCLCYCGKPSAIVFPVFD